MASDGIEGRSLETGHFFPSQSELYFRASRVGCL
jgi:hypothetical protein